jgi:hypothetical protein
MLLEVKTWPLKGSFGKGFSMATQQTTMVKWEKDTIKKLVGRIPVIDSETGEHKRGGKGGQALQYTRKTADVHMEYPVFTKDLTEPSDLVWAIEEIVEAAKPGFTSFSQVLEHLAHGLRRGPAVLLNKGVDLRLTQAQVNNLNLMANVVKQGLMNLTDAVEILQRQGIPDAEQELNFRLVDEVEVGSENDDA